MTIGCVFSPTSFLLMQGNGYERDLGMDSKVFIADIYNRWIYPNDREAKSGCGSVGVCSIRVFSVVIGT